VRRRFSHPSIDPRRALIRRRVVALVAPVFAVGSVALFVPGCGPDLSQTTRLELADMQQAAGDVLRAFATDPVLGRRGPESPPMTIAVGRIENRSSDVITRSEQWYLMQSVAREVASPQGLGTARNIRLVVPAEHADEIRRRGGEWTDFAAGREITHTLNGRFDSITRDTPAGRQELYVFEYTITEIADGRIVTQHAADIRKEAFGLAFN